MKIATQEIEHSQVVLDIEVEDERLQRAFDQAYRRIVNRINVPGFRKGKAPRALVERMVGREALVEDAVEHLVPEVVEAAVKEQDLKMVARPKLEVVSTEPLQVKATVPVQPKVELGDYRTLKVEREPATVEDGQVEQVIDRFREAHAIWEPVERPVAIGDRVAIDLLGEADGQTVVDSKDAEYVVDPDGAQPAPGFADQLVGMEAGDERSLDDALAEMIDPEHKTAVELREFVRQQLVDREEQQRKMAHEDAVVQAVIDQAAVEVPPQLVEEEAQRLLDRLAANLDRQGITIQQYLRFTEKSEAQLRAELMAQGERSVRRSEVLNAVALAEGLEATDQEIRAELAQATSDEGEAEREYRAALDRPELKERLASVLRQRKAVDFLLKAVGGVPDRETADAAEKLGETVS